MDSLQSSERKLLTTIYTYHHFPYFNVIQMRLPSIFGFTNFILKS